MKLINRRRAIKVVTTLGISTGMSKNIVRAGFEEKDNNTDVSTTDAFETIDAHVHAVLPQLPGTPKEPILPDGDADIIRKEMKSANITHALCMPQCNTPANDPLGIERTLKLASLIPGIHPIGFANPNRIDEPHLARVEEELKQGRVKALKAYLGYYYFAPDSPEYKPYYELAARYNLPFIFHTGDTYSYVGKLKYSHPLLIDEISVDYPNVRFVIAHLGCPWFRDVAEIVYKNNIKGHRENVWTDLSGIMCGPPEYFDEGGETDVLKQEAEKIREAFLYSECPHRYLYGSDWPLAPMASYRKFIFDAIPSEHHQAVFHDNAKELFGL